MLKNPVDLFTSQILKMRAGETYVYHTGSLQMERAHSPTLHTIGMIVYGLHILKRVVLRQKRISDTITEYSLKINGYITPVDFDRARKLYLESTKEN